MNKAFKNYDEERKIGEALYLINKEAKIFRDIYNWHKRYDSLSEAANEYLCEKFSKYHMGIYGNDIRIADDVTPGDFSLSTIDEWYRNTESNLEMLENMDEEDRADYKNPLYGYTYEEDLEITRIEYKYTEIAINRFEEINAYIKDARYQANSLYAYKDITLEIVKPEIIGYHRFSDNRIRPMYEIGGFKFHGEAIEEDELPEGVPASEIPELGTISSAITIETNLTFEEAHEIIENYIYEHTATAA